MADWRKSILIAIVALIALIQVMPQVDLPDTTAHEDKVPVIEKARSALASASFPVSLLRATGVSTPAGLAIATAQKDPLPSQDPSFPVLPLTLLC